MFVLAHVPNNFQLLNAFKLCVRLQENDTEIFHKLKHDFGKEAASGIQVFSGTKHTWIGDKLWRMNLFWINTPRTDANVSEETYLIKPVRRFMLEIIYVK